VPVVSLIADRLFLWNEEKELKDEIPFTNFIRRNKMKEERIE